MMRSLIALMLVASAALVALPSASAMQVITPPAPNPQCPVTPAPGPGEGIVGNVKQIAHDDTQAVCNNESQAEAAAASGYNFAMSEVAFFVGVVGPIVDAQQEMVCDFVYGDHDHSGDLGCSEIVVSLSMSSSVLNDLLASPTP